MSKIKSLIIYLINQDQIPTNSGFQILIWDFNNPLKLDHNVNHIQIANEIIKVLLRKSFGENKCNLFFCWNINHADNLIFKFYFDKMFIHFYMLGYV